jgi:ATP-dependent DNA helicase Q4
VSKIHCYGGQHHLETLSKRNPIVKAAMTHHKPVIDRKTNQGATIEFPVIQIASLNRWDAGVVKRELKNLQWTTYEGPQSQVKRSGVLVEFSELALHFQIQSMPSAAGLDQIQEYLYNRSLAREKAELENLRNLFNAFRKVSFLAGNIPEETINPQDSKGTVKGNEVDSDAITVKSEKLKMFIKDYFDSNESRIESAFSDINNPNDENRTSSDPSMRIDDALEAQLRADVRQFVNTHTDHTWTGRAVARIFHGIQSPNFPAKQWGRVRQYWRSHLDIEFPVVSKIATKEVIRMSRCDLQYCRTRPHCFAGKFGLKNNCN